MMNLLFTLKILQINWKFLAPLWTRGPGKEMSITPAEKGLTFVQKIISNSAKRSF
jgi:hypothetical protein